MRPGLAELSEFSIPWYTRSELEFRARPTPRRVDLYGAVMIRAFKPVGRGEMAADVVLPSCMKASRCERGSIEGCPRSSRSHASKFSKVITSARNRKVGQTGSKTQERPCHNWKTKVALITKAGSEMEGPRPLIFGRAEGSGCGFMSLPRPGNSGKNHCR